MLKRKTIAINVTNLSDARYFAAYEVDNIAYVVAPGGSNLGQIKEIIAWVEGPTALIQMDEYDEALIKFALETTGAKGVVLPFISLEEIKQLPENTWSLGHPPIASPTNHNITPNHHNWKRRLFARRAYWRGVFDANGYRCIGFRKGN